MQRTLAWLLMTLLALAVAGYAVTVLLLPAQARPPFVQGIIAARPLGVSCHLLGGAIALVAGAFQLNSRLRARLPAGHRWLGRVYLLAVLVGGSAGLALATTSFGGLPAHAGFAMLALLWLGCTLQAWRRVLQRDLAGHRAWMIRSYALTLAAVTLRILLPSAQLAELPMALAYPAIAWLCWVPNLLLAEWVVRSRRNLVPLPTALPRG